MISKVYLYNRLWSHSHNHQNQDKHGKARMLDKMTNRTEQGEQVNPRILQKNKLKLNLGNAMNTRQRGINE